MSIHALESEQAVIGCALYDPQSCDAALERLRPDMFFEPFHVAAWALIAEARRSGAPADAAVVAERLARHPAAASYGPGYFFELVEKSSLWALPAHIEAIADRATRRAVQGLAKDIAARAEIVLEGSGDLLLAELERGASDVARQSG